LEDSTEEEHEEACEETERKLRKQDEARLDEMREKIEQQPDLVECRDEREQAAKARDICEDKLEKARKKVENLTGERVTLAIDREEKETKDTRDTKDTKTSKKSKKESDDESEFSEISLKGGDLDDEDDDDA